VLVHSASVARSVPRLDRSIWSERAETHTLPVVNIYSESETAWIERRAHKIAKGSRLVPARCEIRGSGGACAVAVETFGRGRADRSKASISGRVLSWVGYARM
jgi:hypothetical protein